jgi:hypothetical protein
MLGLGPNVPSNPSDVRSPGPKGTKCCGSYLVDKQTLGTAKVYQVCVECGKPA